MDRLASSLITLVVVAALMGAVARGLRVGPVEFDASQGRVELRFGSATRRISMLLWALTPVPFALWLFEPKDYGPAAATVFACCLAAGALAVSLEVQSTAWFDSDGVGTRSVWRGQKELAWSEVSQVSFSPASGWFVLRGRDGTKLRVSHLLQGADVFAKTLESAVPAASTTRAVDKWRQRVKQLDG